MGTQILHDIHCDLKLLITSVTGFKPPEEGFRICEKFVLSNIKYHNYLAINSHATKKAIEDVKEKFTIHGKYNLANDFANLVNTFLTSFNFDQHPQHDLQWTLLFLLLNLSSTETNTSKIHYYNKNSSLSVPEREKTLSPVNSEVNDIQEIDWGEYLKESDQEFFCDYRSIDSSDSELSDVEGNKANATNNNNDDDVINTDGEDKVLSSSSSLRHLDFCKIPQLPVTNLNSLEKFTRIVESQKWLDHNIENNWWNTAITVQSECRVISQFPQAHLCKIYDQELVNRKNEQSPNSRLLTGLITEYQAVREILWMFHVQVNMTIYENEQNNTININNNGTNNFHVRSNISIPSLTPIAFRSICSNFCVLFSALQHLKGFEQHLYQLYGAENIELFPPLTFDTYNAAMKQFLTAIKSELIDIEERIMRQNHTVTLLSLSQALKHSTEKLTMLAEVHEAVTTGFSVTAPNWEKSIRLITNLHVELESSRNCARANLCASLYLASLRVYLNIVDTWLSEGRLEDFRNEFLLAKMQDKTADSSNKSENDQMAFNVRINKKEWKSDPIVALMSRKIEEMGRNIELLVTLNRISDMWRLNAEQYGSRVPLNDEFITEVLQKLSKYSSKITKSALVSSFDDSDSTESEKSQEFTDGRKLIDGLEENIQQQILRINNPFLMKVFANYLPSMDISTGTVGLMQQIPNNNSNDNKINRDGDTVDSRMSNYSGNNIISDWGIKIYERLENISPFILPISRIIGYVLEKILDQRYSCASKLVKDILMREYKLEKHLKLMRSIYMMERGHIMKKFYNQMFEKIESNLCRVDADYLTNILEEVLADEWRDTNSNNRWSITLTDNCTRRVLQAVDHTTLNYSVDWPINMILTDQVLMKYNEIFRFQLKLKWALWSLNHLKFIDLEGKDSDDMKDLLYHFNARRLECLRFWLLHAIGSIHSYLSGQVLESLGMIFELSLLDATDLDSIIQQHNHYLNKVYEHCLQTSQFTDIMTTINHLLGMCAHVRDRWERGVRHLIPNELDLMEESYTKYHTYLALALHNAVQNKAANYLAGLASAFNCSIPATN